MDKIKGALSSAGDFISAPFANEEEEKKKKQKEAALAKGKKAIENDNFDPFQYARDQETAIASGNKNAMREMGMSEPEVEAYAGKDAEESDWQGAMGEAVKFLAANRKEKPKPGTPSLGSRNVNFDAGNFYGALQARQQYPMQFQFKG